MKKTDLANEFSKVLHEWLGTEKIVEINLLNEGEDKTCCHSHDFCDSNEAMAEAFIALYGRNISVRSQRDTDLVNNAWALAKNNKFRYEQDEI